MNWLYKNKEINSIEDFPKDAFGFIYITIHLPTGKKYLGKKSLFHNHKKKLTKKELAEQTGPGRKPTHKRVLAESDWKKYFGSEDFIKEKIKEGLEFEFSREIIDIAYNKKHLTYLECKYQFEKGVLENDKWLNSNILGKFFKADFEN